MSAPHLREVAKAPLSTPGSGDGGGGVDGERLARLEENVKHLATKTDVAEIKTLIAERESRLLRWAIGMLIAIFISLGPAVLGWLKYLSEFFITP